MKFLALGFILLVFCSGSAAQKPNNWPHPPAPADTGLAAPETQPRKTTNHRVDTVQLQRQATELLALSKSVQPDIEEVVHGILPKETIEKLKRIEKLSKHLRSELSR